MSSQAERRGVDPAAPHEYAWQPGILPPPPPLPQVGAYGGACEPLFDRLRCTFTGAGAWVLQPRCDICALVCVRHGAVTSSPLAPARGELLVRGEAFK